MTDLTPVATLSPVVQLETTDLALGGTGNPMNRQAQALLNRDAVRAAAIADLDSAKQEVLISGTNIKTINSGSLLGAGDIVIPIFNPADTVFTGTTKTEYLTAGDGVTRDANGIPGDDPHWVEITNNPSTGAGNQLFRMNSYGATGYGNNVHFCRYNGTESAPAAIDSGSFLMSIGYRGHDGVALSQSAAAFQALTTEAWTGTGHGCKFQWQTTPNASTVRTQAFEIGSNVISYRPVGIDITPSAWSVNYRTLEVGLPGCAVRGNASAPEITLSSNLYFDTGYKYGTTGSPGSIMTMQAGAATFQGAPSGTADTAATVSTIMSVHNVTGTGFNAAAAALKVNKDAATSRSINAAGTVNASGADYAEYMRKADGCGDIDKGQIVGITRDGEVTDKWSDAVTFMTKSTAPAYVGGDTWSAAAGVPPERPGPEASDDDWAAYQDEYSAFTVLLEAERLKYDRIAFAGQVPVNVQGAMPGDYIVPVAADAEGGILGVPVGSPTFEQYRSAVGRVIAIESDGRSLIIVKSC